MNSDYLQEERIRLMSEHELLRLLAIEKDQYRPEAISIARDELKRRNTKELTEEAYYQEFPLERLLPNGFCVGCHLETTDESPGNTTTYYFIFGTRLIGTCAFCPVCGTEIQQKWFCFMTPLVPLGKYRVRYISEGRYIGRKLKDNTQEFGENDHADKKTMTPERESKSFRDIIIQQWREIKKQIIRL